MASRSGCEQIEQRREWRSESGGVRLMAWITGVEATKVDLAVEVWEANAGCCGHFDSLRSLPSTPLGAGPFDSVRSLRIPTLTGSGRPAASSASRAALAASSASFWARSAAA